MFALQASARRTRPGCNSRAWSRARRRRSSHCVYDFFKTSPFRYYLLMAAGGLQRGLRRHSGAARPGAHAGRHAADPEARQGLHRLSRVAAGRPRPPRDGEGRSVQGAGLAAGADHQRSRQEITTPSAVPLLIIQGGKRQGDPGHIDAAARERRCARSARSSNGGSIRGKGTGVWVTPSGPTWSSGSPTGSPGAANPDPYVPTGQATIGINTCP